MDRRTFIGGVAGGLLAAPLAARAQKPAMPVIGFLCVASPAQWAPYVAAFRKDLNETGYVEGKNVAIEFRWAEGQYDRLPALAADLVRRQVAVLVATGGGDPVLAAKAATSTIPIVFTSGGDPVEIGLVTSLSHPGSNVTGVSIVTVELVAKRLGLLHELVPKATVIAYIVNPNGLNAAASETRKAQEAARSFGQQLHVLRAGSEQEIDAAFASLRQLRAGALLVGTDAFFNARRDQFVALAVRYAIPAMLEGRESVVAGGLMSYGASFPEVYRQAGVYTGKILNGAEPADLPVLQPTKFELVINTRTAKALGLTIPQSLRVQAELIE
jgi:putative tryptophan/tyrosine transport system substrate-binding protein